MIKFTPTQAVQFSIYILKSYRVYNYKITMIWYSTTPEPMELIIETLDKFGPGILVPLGCFAFVSILAQWSLYDKCGLPGIDCIIPVKNVITFLKIMALMRTLSFLSLIYDLCSHYHFSSIFSNVFDEKRKLNHVRRRIWVFSRNCVSYLY